MDNEKIIYASMKPTPEIMGLVEEAERLDTPGLARAEIYERAQRYVVDNYKMLDLKAVVRRKVITYSGEMPSSFKVRLNDLELDEAVNEILRRIFSITRVMTTFKMKVVLSAYTEHLAGTESIPREERDTLDKMKLRLIDCILRENDIEVINGLLENYMEKI